MPNWKMTKATWSLRLFAWTRIPLIAILRPTLMAADAEQCVVKVPLSWLARNHLGSLYFGALCIGADLAGGLIVMNLIRARRSPVAFLFKDFHADFHKRAEGATVFTCRDGAKLPAPCWTRPKPAESGKRTSWTVIATARTSWATNRWPRSG